MSTAAAPSAWAPFAHRAYRILWLAQFTSNVGTWMQTVGAQWLMGTPSNDPLASADDAGVLRAWEVNDPQFLTLARQFLAAAKTYDRTGREAPVLGTLARTRTLVRRTRAGLLGQQASTPVGASARTEAVRWCNLFEQRLVLLYRSIRATEASNERLAQTLVKRSDALGKQSDTAARQTIALFRQAGLMPRAPG